MSSGHGGPGIRSVSVHQLKALLDTPGEEPAVLDVREEYEYAQGRVPGARLVPLMTVPQHVDELPGDRPVYLVCQVGGRSAQAAEYLVAHGVDAVNVDGGTAEWVRAGYPLQR